MGCATLLVGTAGWAADLIALLGPGTVAAATWLALLSSKYLFLDGISYFGGDQLLWATAPWVVLATWAATRAADRTVFTTAAVAGGSRRSAACSC